MTRMIGSAMVVAAILAAGCTMEDTQLRSQEDLASEQLLSEPPLSTEAVANILIFGDASATTLNLLRSRLQLIGHTAQISPTFRLPATLVELQQYNTVWHVGSRVALTPAERELLLQYLAVGGGVHLTGETVGSDSMNDSLTAIVRAAVEGAGGITIGRQGSIPGQFASPYYGVNERAAGDVATTPNRVALIELVNVGGIGGLPLTSRNVLATGGFLADKVVGAVWESTDLVSRNGSLSIIMDSEWLAKLNETDNDNAKLVQNLQEHLTGSPAVNEPPVAVAEIPTGQNLDCNDNGTVREQVPVRFDGSRSTDPDSGPEALTFTWFERGEPIGFGPTPTIDLDIGNHTIVLVVSDGEDEAFASISLSITCTVDCTPGGSLFTRCHPGCPCDHGEGDCDTEADCLPGLVCLHDAGFAFGYEDDEVDVCSNQCPTLGVGAWNYCSPQCPCDAGEGDCESDADCATGLRCVSDIGPAFGFQREVDICEPR
jgi:hypothetical protein